MNHLHPELPELKSVVEASKDVRLTDVERMQGRERLASFMAANPLKVRLSFFVRARRVAAAFAGSLTLLAGTAGASFAAEGALPGDLLYPMKVLVNEEVKAVLVTDDADKARWQAERAARRLAEAEALARKGELDEKRGAALQARFEVHAEKARGKAESSDGEGSNDAAADVDAVIQGSLDAHAAIVEAIEREVPAQRREKKGDEPKEEKAKEEMKNEVEKVEDEKKEKKRPDADAAARRKEQAKERVAAVREEFRKAAKRVDGKGSSVRIAERVAAGEEAVAEGDAAMEAGDAEAALDAYDGAQRLAQEARALVRAAKDLDVRLDLTSPSESPTSPPPSPRRTWR